MRVTKVVTVTDLTALSLRVTKQTLSRLMTNVGLPTAIANAPGSTLPTRIEMSPVRVVGNGKYRVGLVFPGKYRAVEYGSGIFVGEPAQQIKPKRKRALALPYGYFRSVMWIGQEAQPFATPALEKVAEQFPMEFVNDLNRALSRSRSREATAK